MPLPIGHTAIGLATYELSTNNNSVLNNLKIFIFVAILANMPDFDVIVGLLIKWNGNAFHRGPTHSLIFALAMGILVSRAWKFSSQIPRMRFEICFLIILSHILADFFFTSSPISFFWPFEVSWSSGYSGWGDVLSSVFFRGYQDFQIIIGSTISIALIRFIRNKSNKIKTMNDIKPIK
jgi:membrane-bound metal-dependent hydrolase YbcI (DUF457 family)